MLIRDLIKFANGLDEKGLVKEAGFLDQVISKIAEGKVPLGDVTRSAENKALLSDPDFAKEYDTQVREVASYAAKLAKQNNFDVTLIWDPGRRNKKKNGYTFSRRVRQHIIADLQKDLGNRTKREQAKRALLKMAKKMGLIGHTASTQSSSKGKEAKVISHGSAMRNWDKVTQGTVVVAFGEGWCGACKQQLPYLEEAAAKRGIPIIKVISSDVKSSKYAEKIRAIVKNWPDPRTGLNDLPHLVLLKDGRPIRELVQFDKKNVQDRLAAFLV